jgi:Flp pilus assembly pilin Flp
MDRFVAIARRLFREDDAQDLLEYGFLAVLIAIVVMSTVSTLGNTIDAVLWTPIVQNF